MIANRLRLPMVVLFSSFVLLLMLINFMAGGWRSAFGGGLPADDWFYPYELLNAGVFPYGAGIGDLNNDGRLDVALSDIDPTNPEGTLFVYLQNPNGTLQSPVSYTTGYRPDGLSIADLNNDGLDDVVVALFGHDIEVFLQQPNGTLADAVSYSSGGTYKPDAIATGDFNNDTLMDVAVSLFNAPYLIVFYQNNGGTLDPLVQHPVPAAGFHDMDVGDFNDDGLTDLVQSRENGPGQNVTILLQQNNGQFSTYGLGPTDSIGHVAAGDFNDDGLEDIVLSVFESPNQVIKVYTQNGSGMLTLDNTYDAFVTPEALIAGDINQDGRDDLIAGHSGEVNISLHLQLPDGTMGAYDLYETPFNIDYGPSGSAVGDINQDGLPDVVFANHTNGLVVYYHTVPDFDVGLLPETAVVQPGEPITYTVMITRLFNYSGSVTLSMDSLPAGANHDLPSGPFSVPSIVSFSLTPNPAAPIDFTVYEVTVSATDGQITHFSTAYYQVLHKIYLPVFYKG